MTNQCCCQDRMLCQEITSPARSGEEHVVVVCTFTVSLYLLSHDFLLSWYFLARKVKQPITGNSNLGLVHVFFYIQTSCKIFFHYSSCCGCLFHCVIVIFYHKQQNCSFPKCQTFPFNYKKYEKRFIGLKWLKLRCWAWKIQSKLITDCEGTLQSAHVE